MLYDKAESNCEWLLQHQINNDDDANVSVFRKVVHEVGHAVGIDHYSGGIYYATVIEGAGWWTAGIDFNKYNISWIDIAELRNIYGVRHSYIRWMTADDSGSPLDWPDTSSTGFGSTLSDVGALQNSQDTGYSVFFVRNSDNTQGGDAGNNSVTVYRDSGGWGHQTITAANSTGLRMLSGGALTRTDQEYVVAWHDHNNQLRRQRTIGGGPTNWTSSTPVGFYTTHTAAAAYLASVDRLYLIWVINTPGHLSPGSTNHYQVAYTSSSDNGATWGPAISVSFRSFRGLGFSCMNGLPQAPTWPCSLSYSSWSTMKPVWRRVKPNAANPDLLVFDVEQPVSGPTTDFTSQGVGVTTGRAGATPLLVGTYNRNADEPLPDYAARIVHAALGVGGSYDGRTLDVGGASDVWIGDSYPLLGTPAITHFKPASYVYFLFTRKE